MLLSDIIWDYDRDSELEREIQYREDETPKVLGNRGQTTPDSDDSENSPLFSHTNFPGSLIPSKLQITLGDKTSKVIFNKGNRFQ